nr:fructokinase-like 2, chloroplastic [Ipomoea batatas]
MASLSINLFPSLPRLNINRSFYPYMNSVQLHNLGSKIKWVVTAVSEERVTEAIVKGDEEADTGKRVRRTSKRTSSRTRKKSVVWTSDDESLPAENGNVTDKEDSIASGPTEDSKKTRKQTRKKVGVLDVSDDDSLSAENGNVEDEDIIAISGSSDDSKKSRRSTQKKATASSSLENVSTKKKVTKRRGSKKVLDDLEDQDSQIESSSREMDDNNEGELELDKDGGEDISFTYGWPPLVCCFGAAQHAFVPSARQANRLVDHEAHGRMKDAIWAPEKFMRAPGGSSSNVAVALACLGGKVAFMGKLGDDDFGQSLLYYLNINKVQTRSVCIDNKKPTAISKMKMSKRGALKMTSLKPCAEDSLSKSEINIDVLKEAKLFYFNTFSLLDPNMRSTTFRAIEIAKKLGGVIFYDLNLPLPLWQSGDEAKAFVQQALDVADIIEVTKQELEFLCGINPVERFDTRDNDRDKFTHYTPEVIAPLWHENLKVLFVTNGTSKIHYYTKEHNGAVLGMEDAPLTPYTSDMSATGDGIIAGILRMLTVQPHLVTDKGYLEQTIKYAISCGVVDQWLLARRYGYPPKEGMEDDVVPDPHGIRGRGLDSSSEKQFLRCRIMYNNF